MRVLHLTTHLNMGGITIYIQRLAKSLQEQGVETLVFSGGGMLEEGFRKAGIPLYIHPVRTKTILNPALYFQLQPLIRIIKKERINMLHAHTRVMQVLAGLAGRLTGIPVVTTCHGFYKPKLGRSLFPAWGVKVIAISELVQEHLEKDMKVPSSRIRMIHNGVDIEELDREYLKLTPEQARESFGFPADAQVVGTVARLVRDKGHAFAIKALNILKNAYPQLRLLITGDGPYRRELEKLTAELNLNDKVRFTGNVTDIARAYRAMDIFTLPATWREGFGLSIIEAMTCKLPVIATDIWALSQLIRREETGLLVAPSSEKALADAIERVLTDSAFAQRLGQKARLEVLSFFTMDRMAREVAEVYRQAAGSGR